MSSQPPRSGAPRRHVGKRVNSGQPWTHTVDTLKPRIWFCTGETFNDALIGADEAGYRDEEERPPVRNSRFIPVMEKWFAALFNAHDLPASAHQFIISIDPGSEKNVRLELKFELEETGETITEVFTLADDFQRVKDSPVYQLRMLFVFGTVTEVEDIDYGTLCLVDVTDETPHGFVSEVTFSSDVIAIAQPTFRLIELLPDIEITDAMAEGE